jgi:hypothetical protein
MSVNEAAVNVLEAALTAPLIRGQPPDNSRERRRIRQPGRREDALAAIEEGVTTTAV